MNKSKFNFIFIILISTINLSSSKRFLQYYDNNYNNYDNYYGYNNKNKTKNDTTTSAAEDPGSYLLGWFFIFFFMGLYIICSMKKYPSIADRTDDVWKFMFFANNGILVAATVNIFNIKNLLIDSSPLGLTSLVFIIGSIYYIIKMCKDCNKSYFFAYFEGCNKLGELFMIPCFVWSLVGLTDPCCKSEGYTVTYYSDGHTESTECCHYTWNLFIFLVKRLATIFSIFSYYIFLAFFSIFWFIIKGFQTLIFKCCKNKDKKETDIPRSQHEPKPDKQNDQNKTGIDMQPYYGNFGNQVIINNQNNINNQISEKKIGNNEQNLNQVSDEYRLSNIKQNNNINNEINNSNELPEKSEVEINKPNQNINANNINNEQNKKEEGNNERNDITRNNNLDAGPIP